MRAPGNPSRNQAISLTEVLIVIAVIGILSALALPAIGNLHESASTTKHRNNAQHVAQISAALGALGVAHVLPESLGGVEATVRLLREGVTVTEGAFAGQRFVIRALSDTDIEGATRFLELTYDVHEIRLAYAGSDTSALAEIAQLAPLLASLEP